MIIDFQHHFTPREFVKEDPGQKKTYYDENGAPSYTFHSMLYDLDEHIAMMDTAGIDAAYLSSGAGTGADNETSKKVNDYTRQAEKDYPGRFFWLRAHQSARGQGGVQRVRSLRERTRLPGCDYSFRDERPVP